MKLVVKFAYLSTDSAFAGMLTAIELERNDAYSLLRELGRNYTYRTFLDPVRAELRHVFDI